jgi:hypothetical protein
MTTVEVRSVKRKTRRVFIGGKRYTNTGAGWKLILPNGSGIRLTRGEAEYIESRWRVESERA